MTSKSIALFLLPVLISAIIVRQKQQIGYACVTRAFTDTPKHKTDSVFVILYDKRDTVPVFMEVVANAHLNKGQPVVCINGYVVQKGFVTQAGQWAKEPIVVQALDEKKRPLPNKILRLYQPDYNLNPVKDSLKTGGKR